MPAVSVVINVLNGERFVREAIDSVYAQSYADWEIVLWDNASTDRTAEIARGYDRRLRYFRSERTVPLGEARKYALAEAHGDWIAFVDYDDTCLPHRLARQMAAIGGREFALCYAGVREIDGEGRLIRDVLPALQTGEIFGDLLRQFEAFLQTTMINARMMRRYGLEIDPSFVMCEDYNLFMKLAAKGPVCVVPEVLSVARLLPSSLTERGLERHAIERFATLDQVIRDNPGIEVRHAAAFSEARARGCYYQARYEMQSERYAVARRTLGAIRGVRGVYFLLYLVSFWPGLWRLVHGRRMKSRLTRHVLHRRRKAPQATAPAGR